MRTYTFFVNDPLNQYFKAAGTNAADALAKFTHAQREYIQNNLTMLVIE